MHAGEAKKEYDPKNVDFKDPSVKYKNVDVDQDPHIDYQD